MSPRDATEYSDQVQAAQSGSEVRNLIRNLLPNFSIESIPVRAGSSPVNCDPKALSAVREAFMKEFVRPEITDIAKAIITRAGKTFYLARKVQLLVLEEGWSNFDKEVGKDDCIVLIPVIISGSPITTASDPKDSQGQRQTTFTFTINSEFMIAGRCSIQIADQTRIVCVMLCIGKDIR